MSLVFRGKKLRRAHSLQDRLHLSFYSRYTLIKHILLQVLLQVYVHYSNTSYSRYYSRYTLLKYITRFNFFRKRQILKYDLLFNFLKIFKYVNWTLNKEYLAASNRNISSILYFFLILFLFRACKQLCRSHTWLCTKDAASKTTVDLC